MLKNSLLLSKKITICLLCGSLAFSNANASTSTQKTAQNIVLKTYFNDKKNKSNIKYYYVRSNNHLYVNSKGLKSLHLPMNTKMITRNKEKYYLLNNINGLSFFIDEETKTVYINTKNKKNKEQEKNKKNTSKINVKAVVVKDHPIKNTTEILFEQPKTPVKEEFLFKAENSLLNKHIVKAEPIDDLSKELAIKKVAPPEKLSLKTKEEKNQPVVPYLNHEVLLLETTINEAKTKQSLSYLIFRKQNKIYISERDIEKLNLSNETEKVSYNKEIFYLIDKSNGTSYLLDEKNQTISLTLNKHNFSKTTIDARQSKQINTTEIAKHINNKEVYSNSGAFLNYDLHAQKQSNLSNLSAVFSGNYFNKHGEGEYSFVTRNYSSTSDINNQTTKANDIIRLNTNWTKHDIDNKKTYSFGDFSTKNSILGRNVFLGGFSFSKNDSLNPNFNKISTPTLKGYSSLPSVVDVYLNNSAKYSFAVPPGEFDINNIPTINGNGQAKIVVKDMLGRETSYQQDFFTNSKILKKGVDDYSVSVGLERFNYGTESNDYRDLAVVGNYAKGYTDNLTNEYRGEAKKNYFGAGLSSNYKIEQYSTVISAKGWINKNNSNIGSNYGFSSTTTSGAISYMFNYDKFNKNYYQLGMMEYTDGYVNDRKSLLSATVGINGNKLTDSDIGNFNISYIQNKTFSGNDAKLLGLNYNKTINKNLSLNLHYLKNLNDSKKDMVFFGLTYNLDGLVANYNSTKSDGDTSQNISIQKSASDFAPVSVGYGVQAQSGNNYKIGGEVKTNKGNIDGNVYSNSGNNGFNINARGAIVATEGSIIPTKKINNSFGVVTTKGYSDIPVYHQNKLIGHTDSNGTMIIPNLSPNTENKIDVIRELPITTEALEQPSIYPSVGKRGYISNITLREKKSFTVNAIDFAKEEIPAGSFATTYDINGAVVEKELPVGTDGLIYANYSYMVKSIVVEYVKNGKEKKCSIPINIQQQMNDLTELKERTCK